MYAWNLMHVPSANGILFLLEKIKYHLQNLTFNNEIIKISFYKPF